MSSDTIIGIDSVLKSFVDVGYCDVDIDKAVAAWNNSWSISQWEDEYSLVKFYPDGDYGKVRISKRQAHELIVELDLMREQSPVFRSGATWRKKLLKI
jgi:hypothetical protein